MLIHRPGVYSVNTGLFTCDYYEFMKENRTYITAYTGKYMPEYPWASEAIPYLNVVYDTHIKKYPPTNPQTDLCQDVSDNPVPHHLHCRIHDNPIHIRICHGRVAAGCCPGMDL